MTEEQISKFLEKNDYDIRKTHNARWIDQKCTPDVLCVVADCIINYISENDEDILFTSKDIWFSKYAIDNVHAIFRKVDVDSDSASNEYDKFFGQPIKLFAYAGLLKETKKGRENNYIVLNKEILEFISLRERNALLFLKKYINKVLTDSGLLSYFTEFFNEQDSNAYEQLKTKFQSYTVANTLIGTKGSDGKLECGRIFTKVINLLAFDLNKKGTERGHISKHAITYDMLMYNRDNFRDIYAEKPKTVSRKDYMKQHKIVINEAYYAYLCSKAKQRLRKYNDIFRNGLSEMPGDNEPATNMHHIFPANEFPEISYFLENLIALTPNQHILYAHPKNKTSVINKDYQHDCLLVKTDMIKDNLENGEEKIYSFNDFKYVLRVGFDKEEFMEVEFLDYDGIKTKIELEYV